jgi:hypothetical protein
MYPHDSLSKFVSEMTVMNKREYVDPSTSVKHEAPVLSRWNQESMYQESTKGYVAGMSFLELLIAAGVGGVMGWGAGSLTLHITFSSMPFVAQMLASAGLGAITGVGIGNFVVGLNAQTDRIIKADIDNVMAKNVTKCINGVIKTLASDSDTENKTVDNLKKFKKASEKLMKELDYNTSHNHTYRSVLNKRELPENVKTAFNELKISKRIYQLCCY